MGTAFLELTSTNNLTVSFDGYSNLIDSFDFQIITEYLGIGGFNFFTANCNLYVSAVDSDNNVAKAWQFGIGMKCCTFSDGYMSFIDSSSLTPPIYYKEDVGSEAWDVTVDIVSNPSTPSHVLNINVQGDDTRIINWRSYLDAKVDVNYGG